MNMQLAADLGHRGLPSDNATASLAGDLIWGVKDVAAFIGQTERQAFYLVATGRFRSARSAVVSWRVARRYARGSHRSSPGRPKKDPMRVDGGLT